MKPDQTFEEKLIEALDDVKKCTLLDIKNGRLVLNASVAKQKSHNAYLAAKSRLDALMRDKQ